MYTMHVNSVLCVCAYAIVYFLLLLLLLHYSYTCFEMHGTYGTAAAKAPPRRAPARPARVRIVLEKYTAPTHSLHTARRRTTYY